MKKLTVSGVVVSNDTSWIYDYFDMDYTSPNKIKNELPEDNSDIELEINSPGGSVFAGSEIYTALKEYPGKVHVKIPSIAGSIASVIAMGGDKVSISPTAQIMIHNVSSSQSGDYRDMQSTADALKSMNGSVANAYKLKTGLQESELLEMMNKETWLNAQEALEKGFVDEIMFQKDESIAYVANTSGFGLPMEVISEMMNNKNKYQKQDVAESVSKEINLDKRGLLLANLKLLNLKRSVL